MKKQILTAVLYASELPMAVLAGFELGVANYLAGAALTPLMMIVEIAAVLTWMDAKQRKLLMLRKT